MTEIVQSPQTAVFNQVEELVGTHPSADGLRNAIHAVITWNYWVRLEKKYITYREFGNMLNDPMILANVEYLARGYEQVRGIHIHTTAGQGVGISKACTETCDRPKEETIALKN